VLHSRIISAGKVFQATLDSPTGTWTFRWTSGKASTTRNVILTHFWRRTASVIAWWRVLESETIAACSDLEINWRTWWRANWWNLILSSWQQMTVGKLYTRCLEAMASPGFGVTINTVPECYRRTERFGRSRSSKEVIDFVTNRKRVCDFLLVCHSNLGPILHRFGDIAGQVFCAPEWPHPHSTVHPDFGGVPVASDRRCWGQPEHRP